MKNKALARRIRWMLPAIVSVIGLALLLTAQAEIAAHPSYNWSNPSYSWSYSQAEYIVEVLRIKYIGILLLVCPLLSAVPAFFDNKKHAEAVKAMETYYLRGGIVVCPHCGLSVLGEVGNCPRCGEEITVPVWDGNIEKVRTIVEVPLQTNNIAEVLNMCGGVVQPAKFKQRELDGETVWELGSDKLKFHQCISVAFTQNSVLLQGWRVDRLGETSLTGWKARANSKMQKELLDKMSALIRARKL